MDISDLISAYKSNSQKLGEIQQEYAPIQAEISRLKAEIQDAEFLIDEQMKHNAVKKYVADGLSITYKKSSRTFVRDENILPDKFFDFKKTLSLTKVKAAIESGEISPDVAEIIQVDNIQIKIG